VSTDELKAYTTKDGQAHFASIKDVDMEEASRKLADGRPRWVILIKFKRHWEISSLPISLHR
jgi:hypothetical protein